MKRLFFLFLVAVLPCLRAETIDTLIAEARQANPELKYYEAQVAAMPKAATTASPIITQPLDFPSRESMREALLNLDKELASLYLAEFRFALAAKVRLKAIAYQGAKESATAAADLAARIQALVKMLEQRPAAGTESLIERRILEGVALPFVRTAAEQKIAAEQWRIALNGLLGRAPEAALEVTDAFALPPSDELPAPPERLLLALRKAELTRGLAGFDPISSVEAYDVGSWFTQEGLGAFATNENVTQPGSTTIPHRERLLADAQRKIEREITRRTAAYQSAREVAKAIPSDLIQNLAAVAELADRQYRVGALPVNLLIEANREWLSSLESRNETVLQVWRNRLDLELLQLPAPHRMGTITVNPKN